MMLVRLLVTSAGHEIQAGGASLIVSVSRRGPALQLTFRGPWGAGKKSMLIRNLFAKQFEPVIPRLRIHLRRSR